MMSDDRITFNTKYIEELLSNLDGLFEKQKISMVDYLQIGLLLKITASLAHIEEKMRANEL